MSDQAPPEPPVTDAERRRAFNKALREELKAGIGLIKDTEGEISRLLQAASEEIARTLAGAPTEFQSWRLTQLQEEVKRVLAEYQAKATATVADGLNKSWAAGQALVDAPLAAAGVAWSPVMLDGATLQGMRAFTTSKIAGATAEMVNKVNGELASVMMGAQTPYEAVTKVRELVGSGGEKRATMIVRTELGGAWSAATQARQEQAKQQVPGMKKQWRRSGKRLARHRHEAIDGQIQDIDKPFVLEGGVRLMFPRDPKAPIGERANCGCISLPYVKSWEVLHPKEQPFTPEELNVSQTRRLLEDSRHSEFENKARALWSGKTHADGSFLTAGRIDDDVLAALQERGITPATREIAVGDRQLLHMRRDAKVNRKNKQNESAALPEAMLVNLPGLMERPRGIYLEKASEREKGPVLIYILDGPADANGQLPKVVVKIAKRIENMKHEPHNWITTGSYVSKGQLDRRETYVPIRPLK